MSIRWITTFLGTGQYGSFDVPPDTIILDVRDMVDKSGNDETTILKKINHGVDALKRGQRIVVCCDYGISRSNAIAAGILAVFEGKSFDSSLRQIIERTGEKEIKVEVLMDIRKALGFHIQTKDYNNQPSIFITGGSGFIGKNLQAALDSTFRVFAPSHAELDIMSSAELDLLVSEKNINYIVHLANPKVYTSNLALGQTITMLRNIIDVCLAKKITLIYPSCWEIYSGYAGTLLVDEAISPRPRGIYGETKYLAEILIDHCVHTSGLQCATLRLSTFYGPNGNRPKFLYHFIENIVKSQPIITHRYKNGEPFLDLIYIDDVISAIISVIRSGYIGKLNVGTGVLKSTREIALIICEKLNRNCRIDEIPINANVASIAMNWACARKEIGWEPKISLEVGIDRILKNLNEEQL